MAEAREEIINFCELIIQKQKIIDKRYDDLLEFITWGIRNLPEVVKEQIVSSNIIAESDSNYSNPAGVGFTIQDYSWWKFYREKHPYTLIKPIKDIEKNICDKVKALFSEYVAKTSKGELEKTLKEIDELHAKN